MNDLVFFHSIVRWICRLVIVFFIFGGCKAVKTTPPQIIKMERAGFCSAVAQLMEELQKDEKLKAHFGIKNELAKVYFDTLVYKGIPYSFRSEVAELRAEKEKVTDEEAFKQVETDRMGYLFTKYRTNCLVNTMEKRVADIEVRFWYSKKNNLIALDATNILKKPGYSMGYLYLVEIDKNGEIRKIDDAFWES